MQKGNPKTASFSRLLYNWSNDEIGGSYAPKNSEWAMIYEDKQKRKNKGRQKQVARRSTAQFVPRK